MVHIIHQPIILKMGDKIKEHLNLEEDDSFDKFYFVVAFVKRSGVSQIQGELETFKENGGEIRGVVGIDANGTSEQGLQLLLKLADEIHIYYDKNRSHTFHPKIYFFEKTGEKAKVYVGSSNLTYGGLFSNYETGVELDFDLKDSGDITLFTEIKKIFENYTDSTDVCCNLLDNSLLSTLIADGKLDNENVQHPIESSGRETKSNSLFGTNIFAHPPKTYSQENGEEEEGDSEYTELDDLWRKYGTKLKQNTKEGINLHWKIGKKNNHKDVHLWALKLISENEDMSAAKRDQLLKNESGKKFPHKTMEGTRALFLSKVLGLITKRSLNLTEAYYELVSKGNEIQVLSDQLEKFYFWSNIFSKTNRHVSREERKPPNEYFHIYPMFFIYEILIILKEKYGYQEIYLTEFELKSFLFLAQEQSNVEWVTEMVFAYREDPKKERIKNYLMEANSMDSRFYPVLKLCKYFNWTQDQISVNDTDYADMKKKLMAFKKLLKRKSLIVFDEKEPLKYYKMLHSKKNLVEYHLSI